jgi:hypothetical protein
MITRHTVLALTIIALALHAVSAHAAWIEVATSSAADGAPGDRYDGAAGDFFGARVAVDDDTVVVGSFLNGPGAVYVFERDASSPHGWAEVRKLVASDGEPGRRAQSLPLCAQHGRDGGRTPGLDLPDDLESEAFVQRYVHCSRLRAT